MLVEDHVAFRVALASLLTHQSDLEVVAQAGSLAEAREALDGRLDARLDVAVVDLSLPDGDGSELIRELRQMEFWNLGCDAERRHGARTSRRRREGESRRGARQDRVYPDHRRGGKAPDWGMSRSRDIRLSGLH